MRHRPASNLLQFTRLILWLALLSMIAGHLGTHQLSWRANQISSYAAHAPLDFMITTAMILIALALVLISLLTLRYSMLGRSWLTQLVPLLAGGIIAGLYLVIRFEETAANLDVMRHSELWAIRIQSFHDAGLYIFYYGALGFIAFTGMFAFGMAETTNTKLRAFTVILLAPISYLLMTTPWTELLILSSPVIGIKQRAGLLCLWLALLLLLPKAKVLNSSREAKL